MALPPERRWTQDDLVGAWECFAGDGIHGWDRKVIVFARAGDALAVEFWLPMESGKRFSLRERLAGLYPFSRDVCSYVPTDSGFRLTYRAGERTRSLEIETAEDGTFVLSVAGTTAGLTRYRRTTSPTQAG